MLGYRHVLVGLGALLLQGQGLPQGPAELYGPLFVAVQQSGIFPDSKTFADAVPRAAPAAILSAYRRESPRGAAALRAFVLRFFEVRGERGDRLPLRAHIRALWPVLGRVPFVAQPGSSALPLPQPYVVPGDRFQELYYWDSYFTMLGLRADGQQPLVDAMLANFVDLVERYGFVPNGTRSYYLSRSQPPFLALMMELSDDQGDVALARRRLAALVREHDFWMRGEVEARRRGAAGNVVRMPDGSLLNRYWDERATPRDEAWREDRKTAAASLRPEGEVQRDLRAAAESGWDFSSRWLAKPDRLASIRTTQIVPVDLNSLLWSLEHAIADRSRRLGDGKMALRFELLSQRRATTMSRYLWLPEQGRFADWDCEAHHATSVLSAATLYPLFVGLASRAQAASVARLTHDTLVAPGGVRTTLTRTGQQWDAPNGWAPLQWIAVAGLQRYGREDIARDIARRWVATVQRTYVETGRLLEKYDIEERRPGGGGEYPTQEGFGWTNGVTAAMLERWPEVGPGKQ